MGDTRLINVMAVASFVLGLLSLSITLGTVLYGFNVLWLPSNIFTATSAPMAAVAILLSLLLMVLYSHYATKKHVPLNRKP
jgi:uncharacterized membrane protein (DUF485 family)